MAETPVLLTLEQRSIINEVIAKHCEIRDWHLHAVNCRSNHCHTVITANGYSGDQVRDQLKSWGRRRLTEHQGSVAPNDMRENWWSRKGSVRYLFDEESLEAAIRYTLEAKELGGSSMNRS